MATQLLLVTLGPVQDFIAQARRTRDLWFGSHVLSELSRAAARALATNGARLIFPAMTAGDPELAYCVAPTRTDGTVPRNIANKILAEVDGDAAKARDLAAVARSAILAQWGAIAEGVRQRCFELLARDKAVGAVWKEQIDTLVEFAATWTALDGVTYTDARNTLERTLAGRKNLRDFTPWKKGRPGAPKSSLDGARETVIEKFEQGRPLALLRKYRISQGEQLDAVGLVKRAGGEPEHFVPLANIALARWLEIADAQAGAAMRALEGRCGEIGISGVQRGDVRSTRSFARDAQVFFPDRWSPLFGKELHVEVDAETWGRSHVAPILKEMSAPNPYVACLVADGDHMGRALDKLHTPDEHRDFSRELARFAADAREIVQRDFHGMLVYAGGDDVLAFVCLPDALRCAKALRDLFEAVMKTALATRPDVQRPTLSVGVGVGHLIENMGDLLDLGRKAEKLAKGSSLPAPDQRDALAVILDKRSGGAHAWRAKWGEAPSDRVDEDIALLRTRLSTKKVYEVARTVARLPKPSTVSNVAPARQKQSASDEWRGVLQMEVERVLARNEADPLSATDVGLVWPDSSPTPEGAAGRGVGDGHGPNTPEHPYESARAAVERWVARMLVGALIAEAIPTSKIAARKEAP